MKTNLFFTKVLLIFFLVNACSSENDTTPRQDFAVAFENPSASFLSTDDDKDITIVFAPAATSDGSITISYLLNNTSYGTDFTTLPFGDTGSITLPFNSGDNTVSLKVNKLQNPIEGDVKSIDFSIDDVTLSNGIVSGNTSLNLSFTETAALGAVIAPNVGGVNYTNSVYIDLSAQTTTEVRRDTWELAFHSGTENKVFLNSSMRITAAELSEFTDLNAVTSTTSFSTPLVFGDADEITVNTVEDYKIGVKQSYSMYGEYADYRDGSDTAISTISTTDDENKVYLVYMGAEIPTVAGEGSTNHSGDDRKWYKIRILMEGADYKLQFAELEATEFTEVTINKNNDFNTVAFSLINNTTVEVEPIKEKWDINFAGVFGAENGPTYTDYVIHNTLGGVSLYQVNTGDDTPSYKAFTLSNVDEASLDSQTRNIIGSGWRNPFVAGPAVVNDDRYFVIKDVAANYYKLHFTAVVNENGERGNPKFEYELLE